jgi:hypothetical protein
MGASVCCWPLADMPTVLADVRLLGEKRTCDAAEKSVGQS